jgi:hypothetical protein
MEPESSLPCSQAPATKDLYALSLFPTRATCPANLYLLDLFTRIVFGEEYGIKLVIAYFSPLVVNSSLLGLIMFLSHSKFVNYYYYY